MQVREWAFREAVYMGSSAEVLIAGDWNEEPDESPAVRWAMHDGWGGLWSGQHTRWRSEREIDWGIYKGRLRIGSTQTDSERHISDHKM
eukprot:6542595-Alexandrium_andersonii.AAC.1